MISVSSCLLNNMSCNWTNNNYIEINNGTKFFENLGLTDEILNIFKEKRKISKLYEWQKECLNNELLLNNQNFILSLPPGAGKTLIAEVLMLREALVNKRSCIFILPYIAIVQEKISALQVFETTFGIILEEYAASKGRLPPFKRQRNKSVYICTIEKANMLVNSLIECNRINEIGLVIADEFHMIGEGDRGSILEQCLTKLLCVSSTQIIGISATLNNVTELSKFLRSKVYKTNFRPIECKQRVKIGNYMYNLNENGELHNGIKLPPNKIGKKDIDGIVPLLDSIVPKKSVIIFCPSRKNCENICQAISSIFPSSVLDYRLEERKTILRQIKEENDGKICPILEKGINCGIAYHHSGLTKDERELIETAFKNGIICIICATSTLAAGVNLPARRVIIRSPYVGKSLIKKTQYLQMIGRAGRAGYDDKGDSIVMLKDGVETELFMQMVQGPLEDCKSNLGNNSFIESFCLDLIYLKICNTTHDLQNAIVQTLYGIQNNSEEVSNKVKEVVLELTKKNMIIKNENNTYKTTKEGLATFNANFNPSFALEIKDDLMEILCKGIVLSSHFHLLYAVVPADVTVQIDWNTFYNEFKTLSDSERALMATIGIREQNIVQYFASFSKNQKEAKASKIYIAFMLRQIWNQRPIWEVAQYFDVERGWLQSTLQATCTQAGAIVRFSEKIDSLWPLKYLLPEMVKKLSLCKFQEVIPLLNIDCIKWNRAKQLYLAGFKTVASIAKSEPWKLIEVLDGKLSLFHARRIINSAKSYIRDQIAEKTEELETIGLKLDDVIQSQF